MANERILVVDDEKGVVRSCVRILQRRGFIVSGRTDSQSVPELLRQEAFDLLLTDIRMPKIDGLELLRIAKEIDPHLTVILITGYGTMEDAIKAIRLGAQDFLMKPFEPEELVETVQDCLARRTLLRDSLRLQTLLPLLEINHTLQISGGETSLVRQVLEIAYRETGASRLTWLKRTGKATDPETMVANLTEVAVICDEDYTTSQVSDEALQQAIVTGAHVWITSEGMLSTEFDGQPNITRALLPMIIKGKVVGILTAETGGSPFNKLSLELLSVLAGQLAIIIENVQLFQQAETLRAFNDDLIQNLSNGIIAIDDEHNITALNPAAEKMLGCTLDDALTRPLSEVVAHASDLVAIFGQTLETGESVAHREITLAHEDGRQLPISISTAPMMIDQAGHSGVVGVLEDLSEVKALEAERRRLDRLVALGEMSAVVAHEIRNPIAGVSAGVEYLTRRFTPTSPEYEGAHMIQGEIKRINRILEDILFVARPLKLNVSPESIPEIIDSVLQRYQPQIDASQVTTISQHQADLPPLQVDRQRLEQVFTNLVLNATQAMGEGGQITMETYLHKNGNNSPGSIIISVADDGPGIPDDIRRRVFEPFFTTKTRGTGLGLTVAHRIIEEHHGSIRLNDAVEQGTNFIIELPLKRDTSL